MSRSIGGNGRRYGLVPAILVAAIFASMLAPAPAVSATITADGWIAVRDCGLGVVTVQGRHQMRIADPTVEEIGKRLEVAGEIYTCQPGSGSVPLSAIGYPCAADAIVTHTRPVECSTTSDTLCRALPGAMASTFGGLSPNSFRSHLSRCNDPDCVGPTGAPPPKAGSEREY